MNLDTVKGRALTQLFPEINLIVEEATRPMINDPKHIHTIVDYIKDNYSEYDNYMFNLFVIACVYNIYCPGSFFKKKVMKMQSGLRDEIKGIMGYNSSEMVNYYHQRCINFYMRPKKPFRIKVDEVKNAFRHLSVIETDWQLKLK